MDIKRIEEKDGFSLLQVDEIPSTNTHLKNEYDKYQDNTILWAINQTEGRGRYDRRWESKNDLTFSILFKEKYNSAIIAPLAIILALNDYNINAKIKWPNDIYLYEGKLSGILIEDVYEGEFKASIVGIGINMNDYPGVNGIGIGEFITDMKELIFKVCKYFKYLTTVNTNTIINMYREYSNVIGKTINYKEVEYLVKDIDKDGHLIIENDNETKTISCDEISITDAIIM